ncbi:hypothetical protein [Actinokineospora sp. NPDC004072]
MTLRYVATLLRLALRSRRQLASAAAVLVALALTTCTFVVVNAIALSGDQLADRNLGVHDQALTVGVPFGDDLADEHVADLVHAVRRAGGQDPWPSIRSFSVVPDDLAAQHSAGRTKTVSYVEGDAVEARFPGSYPLEAGRWPAEPGEVVLSTALAGEIGRPASVPVFAGHVELRVVGSVTPVFGEESWWIIAAPGTWRTFPAELIAPGFAQAAGQARVFWSGDADPGAVAAALAAVGASEDVAESILTSHESRVQFSAQAPLTERLPLLHTYPAILLAALASLFVVSINGSRQAGILARLSGVGLARGTVRAALVGALALVAAAAVGLGPLAGLVLGLIGRLAVVPALSDHPLSPMPSPVPSSLLAGVVAVAVCVAGAWLRLRDARGWGARVRRVAAAVPWAWLRRVLAALLVARGCFAASGVPTLDRMSAAAIQFLAGLLLLTPDLLALATRLLSTAKSTTLTARRLIEGDRARHALAATALACCIAVPTAVATLQATQQRTDESRNHARVAPGQIWVSSGNSSPETAARVAELVGAAAGVGAPAVLGGVDGRFSTPRKGGGSFGILVLASVDDLKVFTDHPTAEAAEVLRNGGVVDWTDAGVQQSIGNHVAGQWTSTPQLPTTSLQVDPAYQAAFAGVILQSTAERLGLRTDPARQYVFDGLDDAAIQRAVDRVAAEGINPKYVEHHVVPLPTELPGEWYLGTAGLALTGFGLLWAVQRGQARLLRDYAARFLAIGLPRRWSLRVLLTQALHALVVALLVAVPGGAIPLLLITVNAPVGLVLDIPTGFILATVALSAAAAVAAAGLSLRALRPAQVEG